MTTAGNSKSLKGQNRWHLWLLIAMNAAAFYAALNFGDFESSGFRALVDSAIQLLPVGLATVVTTIANGLLSADTEAGVVRRVPMVALMGASPVRGTSLALSQDNESAAAPSPSSTAKVALWVELANAMNNTSA